MFQRNAKHVCTRTAHRFNPIDPIGEVCFCFFYASHNDVDCCRRKMLLLPAVQLSNKHMCTYYVCVPNECSYAQCLMAAAISICRILLQRCIYAAYILCRINHTCADVVADIAVIRVAVEHRCCHSICRSAHIETKWIAPQQICILHPTFLVDAQEEFKICTAAAFCVDLLHNIVSLHCLRILRILL